MSRTLGIDVGTNSVGWCLVEDHQSIIDWGVYIFPEGAKIEKGIKEISRNMGRQIARTARRRYHRYKLRRKRLREQLAYHGMLPKDLTKWSAREVYGLRAKALDQRLSTEELGRVLLHLSRRRGFRSGRKEETEDKELQGMKKEISGLGEAIKKSGARTLGEYFYFQFLETDNIEDWRNSDEPLQRLRSRHTGREMYLREFDLIWESQKAFHPDLLTDSLKEEVRDRCIFYQRPLKSAKHLVAKCRFEPRKRVAPRSSLDFQRFRYWQKLADLRVSSADRVHSVLTTEEKHRLVSHLEIAEKLSLAQVKKVLGLKRNTIFNTDESFIPGNVTNTRLRKALGPEFWEGLPGGSADQPVREKSNGGVRGPLKFTRYLFWHTLQFYEPRLLKEYAVKEMGLNEAQAKAYINVRLESDYGSLSSKALQKILPILEEGFDYSEACKLAGYRHSLSLTKEEISKRPLLSQIPNGLSENILSPVVKKASRETFRLINQVLKEHGKPDRIRVELARSLKKPKKIREQMRQGNKQKMELREAYRDFIMKETGWKKVRRGDLMKFELWLELQFAETELEKIGEKIDLKEFQRFAKRVSPNDQEKFQLWLECGRISPYTGQIISLTQLFSPKIEIEHIVPYSRSLDDSFMNKTLAEKNFNTDKGERLPWAWFEGREKDLWRAFVKRVRNFPKAKQEKFLMQEIPEDFIPNQLNNTAQIGKEVLKGIEKVCRDCRVTNGQVTSKLRKMWKLGALLHSDDQDGKNRKDHRHHALDALVIACTHESHIQALSRDSQFEDNGFHRVRSLPFPWETLRLEAHESLQEMLIVHRKEKRLLVSRTNPYRHLASETKNRRSVIQKIKGVRGPLHEETHYGQIYDSHKGEESYVYRRKLEDLTTKQLNLIIDPAIRKIIKNHVEEHGGNLKKAMKEPVFMISRDGKKKIPIKRVRVKNPATDLIQLRPNENPNLYVAAGNNWCLCIYGDQSTGKQKGLTVSFFNAVQRKLKGQNLYPSSFEGRPLSYSLQQNDLVVIYKSSTDEIDWEDKADLFSRLFRVVKFDKNLNVTLAAHHLGKVDKPPHILRKTAGSLRAVPVKLSPTGKILNQNA